MFKVGHPVTTPGGLRGTVVSTDGYSLVIVKLESDGTTLVYKQADLGLHPSVEVEGWTAVGKGMLTVGTEVMTPDGFLTTVTKLDNLSWVSCTTRPKLHRINSLRVRIAGYVAKSGDFSACQPVDVNDPSWKGVWSTWKATLTATHIKAIQNYSGSWYGELNAALRRGISPTDLKYCDRLDAALAKGKTDRPIIVWRSGSRKFSKDTPVGTEFTDAAFGSCTTSKIVALGWGDPAKALFEIRCLAGTRGAYIRSLSMHAGEEEFLLPRNATYRVAAVRDEGSRRVFTVDLISQF